MIELIRLTPVIIIIGIFNNDFGKKCLAYLSIIRIYIIRINNYYIYECLKYSSYFNIIYFCYNKQAILGIVPYILLLSLRE